MTTKDARTRLREAALALAAEKAITDASVAEVCRRAGVTRDSFYRFAARPEDLLADALADDLARLPPPDPSAAPGAVMWEPSVALFSHVQRHRAAYTNALQPHLGAKLRDVLITVMTSILSDYVREQPGVLPRVGGRPADPAAVEVFVAYAASGAVGAVERWLSLGQQDVERGAALLNAASAGWWFLPEPAGRPEVTEEPLRPGLTG